MMLGVRLPQLCYGDGTEESGFTQVGRDLGETDFPILLTLLYVMLNLHDSCCLIFQREVWKPDS